MSHKNHHSQPPSYATDPNTMFVQADPSSFRNIVQKLTGAPPELSSSSSSSTAQHKLPLTPKRQAFKLHERRQSSKKMELKINNNVANDSLGQFHRGFLVSPVSHLDPFWSPHSARENHHATPGEEEQKAIAEKGFYFLPSPRSGDEPAPELLPLFPQRNENDFCHSSY
ncbi:VQ motif-containing protein 11 [Raphanus sativus]|uniref:VQ motif-containing protein 11 n=1 Tax=Raphanus sativus TaxID=3726 RepID=A0A6J0M896_RAPSA|nr:VQ motif-containing protein 11 [Raphanus sativus]KAJ4909012.1 VQ motif-containing protein 11 [Raphanus sativus]